MALSDLFRGMKAGTDMYFETENEAQDLAAKRLTLLGLEQKFADEQYLKPAELADRLSRHRHSTVKNTADANSILKLRPLEDTYNQAVHRYNTGEVGIKQAVQDKTRGTQVGTGVAQKYNDYRRASELEPKQIDQNISAAELGGIKNRISYDIEKGSYDTQVDTGLIDNDTKRIEAGTANRKADSNADYSTRVHQFLKDNPQIVQNMAASDVYQEFAASRLALQNTLTQEQLALKNREAEGLLVEMERNPQQAEAILQSAFDSDDVVMQGAALDIITGLRTQYEQQQAAALKAAGKSEQPVNPLVGLAISDPVTAYKAVTGADVLPTSDGRYLTPNNEILSGRELGERAAVVIGESPAYFDEYERKYKAVQSFNNANVNAQQSPTQAQGMNVGNLINFALSKYFTQDSYGNLRRGDGEVATDKDKVAALEQFVNSIPDEETQIAYSQMVRAYVDELDGMRGGRALRAALEGDNSSPEAIESMRYLTEQFPVGF